MKPIFLSVLLVVLFLLSGCQNEPDQKPESGNVTTEKQPEKETATPREPIVDQDGYTHLQLDDFEVFEEKPKKGAPENKTATWSMKEDMILCTGLPRGYIYTKKKHADFTFEVEIRYPETEKSPEELEESNTGILVYISEENRIWPVCLEVQGKQKEMGHIKANGRGDVINADLVKDDQKAREEALKKVGEWNLLKVVSSQGKLVSYLNGTKICENEPGELKEGSIGLQSERNPLEFRNLRIREEKK